MNTWYSARLLFRSTIDGATIDHPLCEESIRILRAETDEGALVRATEIGRAAEHDYPNEKGESVRWSFVAVLEVQDLCQVELLDGTEVFSRLFRDDGSGTLAADISDGLE